MHIRTRLAALSAMAALASSAPAAIHLGGSWISLAIVEQDGTPRTIGEATVDKPVPGGPGPRQGCLNYQYSYTAFRREIVGSWGPLGGSQPASASVIAVAIATAIEFGQPGCLPCFTYDNGIAYDVGVGSTANVQSAGTAASASAANPGQCSPANAAASATVFVGGGGTQRAEGGICILFESSYELTSECEGPTSANRLNLGSAGASVSIRLLPSSDTRMQVTVTEDLQAGDEAVGSPPSIPVQPTDPIGVATYTEALRDAYTLADLDIDQGMYILFGDGTAWVFGGYNDPGFAVGSGPFPSITGGKTVVLDAGATAVDTEYFSTSDSFSPGTLDLNADGSIDCNDRAEIVLLASAGIAFPNSRYNARADFDLDLDIDADDVELFKSALFAGMDSPYHASGAVSGVCFIADANCDGSVAPGDFSAWIALFNTMSPFADANNNGAVEPGDFSAWIAAYNAALPSCP